MARNIRKSRRSVGSVLDVLESRRLLSAAAVSIGPAPGSSYPGGIVTLSASFAPGAGIGEFYLTSDDVVGNGDDVQLIGRGRLNSDGSIPAGNYQIPNSVAPGTYRLAIVADTLGGADDDLSDNTLLGPSITITSAPAQPDLAIADLMVGPVTEAEPGGSLWTNLQTLTPASVPEGAKLKIFLSTDTTLSSDDSNIFSMDARSGPYIYAPVIYLGIPAGVAAGQYHVIAMIDADNTVTEADETNNVFVGNTITIHAAAEPTGYIPQFKDVSLSDDPVVPGQRVNIDVRLSGFDDYYHVPVSVYLSANDVAGDGDDILLGAGVATYDPTYLGMQSGHAYIPTVALPTNISAGTYHLVAAADGAAPYLDSQPVTVVPLVTDIVPTAVATETTTTAAGASLEFDLSFSINSPADSTYRGYFNVDYYLSTDDVFGNADDVRLTGRIDGLNPHMTLWPLGSGYADFTQPDSVTIPASVAAGTYHLFAVADPEQQIAESDESNNVLSGPVITVVTPEVFSTIPAQGETARAVAAGAPARTSLTIKNPGKSAISRNYKVRFYLSDDAFLSDDDQLFSTRSIHAAVKGGKELVRGLSYTLPKNAEAGTQYLIVAADVPAVKSVSAKALSAASHIETATKINVLAPSLAGEVVSSTAGTRFTRVTVRVSNSGTGSYNSAAVIRLLTDSDDPDTVLTVKKHLSLKAGQHRDFTVMVPGKVDGGLKVDLA